MVGIGHRSIKMAIGAGLAIWLATLFNLEYATFAAIIVIICIEDSKMKTLLTMREKFIASLLALILGALFLELLGYHTIYFALFLLLFFNFFAILHFHFVFLFLILLLLYIFY